MIKTAAFEEQSHLFPILYVTSERLWGFPTELEDLILRLDSLQSEVVSSGPN